MKVTVTEESASERTLEVVVDSKKVESAFQKAFRKNLRQFALPGFRKGRVPESMAQRYITDGALVSDVVNDLVPRAFEEAIKEKNLEPISQPNWDLVQNERGKDLIFKASFIVTPFIEIENYEGLEITQEREEITDAHVQDTLDRMRSQHAEFITLEEDRGLEEGDHATVDYTSYQDGEEIENGGVTNYVMEMKPENYIDGFVSNLLGAKAGEEREFDITFPEDYSNPELAGETISFKFKVHDIKVRRLPELNDEFVQSHTPHENLEKLKEAVLEHLEEGIKGQADGQAMNSIIKQLLEQVPEEVIPSELRQHHAQRAIRTRMYELAQQGLEIEQLLQARGLSQEAWLQEMMGTGLFEARLEVLYKSLAQSEKVVVEESELDEIIKAEAPAHKLKPRQLRRQMEKNGTIEMLRYNILTEKIQKLLLEKAAITYVAPGTQSQKSESADSDAESKAPKTKKKASKTSKATSKSKGSDQEEAAPESKKKATKASSKTKTSSKEKKPSKDTKKAADESAEAKPAKAKAKATKKKSSKSKAK